MLLSELACDTSIFDREARKVEITGVTADSRAVRPGYLFAALPGVKVDGSAFIADALAKGAAAVLVGSSQPVQPGLGVPVLADSDPRRRYAQFAARFYAPQPECVVAVTGTNGKTSVTSFLRQIWQAAGFNAASLGTVGVVTRSSHIYGNMTTPEPVALHSMFKELKEQGIEHVAIEASSHGIQQRRLDGVKLAAAGYTNITRDHLDYHGTFESYLGAKLRLFDTVLDSGAKAVINLDDRHGETFAAAARISGNDVITVGRRGQHIRLLDLVIEGLSQRVTVDAGKGERCILVPLVGEFQVSNALVAAGLAMATGVDSDLALSALSSLHGARGRLELVGYAPNGAPIFVDYAHTPDALEVVLKALRPFTRSRLSIVFGAGGDRDTGKRRPMGEAAAKFADLAYVTDDNPRSEDPALIRAMVLEGCPDGVEIGDRQEAIRVAINQLDGGDVLLVAGKGHETGQVVAGRTLPFSDHEAVRRVLPRVSAPETPLPLWTVEEVASVTRGRVLGEVSRTIHGLSIDTRTMAEGDIFLALKGENSDGHAYVGTALEKGAALAIVAEAMLDRLPDHARPVLVVPEVMGALEAMAVAARLRSRAQIVAVTGSVGKTSTKEALRAALSALGPTHAAAASFNNHIGVPLTLARMDRTASYGVFEIGMNRPGEISPLVKMVRPHVAVITNIAAVHMEHMGSLENIARAKAEILDGLEPGGTLVLNRDNAWFDFVNFLAQEDGVRVVSFGEHGEANARMTRCVLKEDCSTVTALILGEHFTYKISVPGRHLVDNSLAVLAAVKLLGGDIALAGMALGRIRQPKGRGLRTRLQLAGGTAILIDESYNANPTSMRAALALLAQATPAQRRVAVLGDMLELGDEAVPAHQDLLYPILDAGVDRVYCCGPLMKTLWQALPHDIRGAYADTAGSLLPILEDDLRANDIVMVKGSNGSRMVPLVDSLIARYGSSDDGAPVV